MIAYDISVAWVLAGRFLAALALLLRQLTQVWVQQADDSSLPANLAGGALGEFTADQFTVEVQVATGLLKVFDDSRVFAIFPIIGIAADGTLSDAEKVAAIQAAIASAGAQPAPRKTLQAVASADRMALLQFLR